MSSFTERLNYTGDLTPVIKDVCRVYKLGELFDWSIIETGYEDCNIALRTASGKYVVKIFSKLRTGADIARYCQIMTEIRRHPNICHPELLLSNDHEVLLNTNGLGLVVMRFIEGDTFYQTKRVPDNLEFQEVIKQAAAINKLKLHPTFIVDSWAIPNIESMYAKVKKYLEPDDNLLLEKALGMYQQIPISDLPQCFVHGDLTKTNLIKSRDGKIYVIDFSVANWYPRIQELAVLAANLLHQPGVSLTDTCNRVSQEYDRHAKLSEIEKQQLFSYAVAGKAMELLGAHQEKFINGNVSSETEYWLELGRSGLSAALNT
jgi:Ser/Thr protein kinase RdoA (MazF antagonist)